MTTVALTTSWLRTDAPISDGIETNLPASGNLWLEVRKSGLTTILAKGMKRDGTTNALFAIPELAGESLSIIAYGFYGAIDLHYSNDAQYTPGQIIQFTTVIGTPAAVTQTKVAGTVQIDGAPAARLVRAFTYDSETMTLFNRDVTAPRPLGETTSDPDTGDYELIINSGYTGRVFVVAFDDYGQNFTADMAVDVGDLVHPTTPNGHVFEATSAGTLPATEPTWIVDTETGQLYGTASMIAVPFYRPMVHGPVMPEVTIINPVP